MHAPSALVEQELLDLPVRRAVQGGLDLPGLEGEADAGYLHAAALAGGFDLDLFRLAEGLEPVFGLADALRTEVEAELLSEVVALDLARLQLVEQIEGCVLCGRALDLRDGGGFRARPP